MSERSKTLACARKVRAANYRHMPNEPTPAEMMALRIAEKRQLAADIFGFDLRAPDARPLPEFTSGAHISVRAPNGMLRKYSLCNAPAERSRYVIAIKREDGGRGGSLSMITDANAGDALPVSAPHNNFALVNSAAGYIFIAGGIGIAPILSMVRYLKATGGRFRLYYCTRSPDVTAFREELAAPEFHGQAIIHHDGGDPQRALDLWPILERPTGMHVYCCGPRGMMQAVRDMTGHWPATAVHFEAFTDSQKHAPQDRPFRVRLARSHTVVDVPVGTTILEALRAAGHEMPSSCESGSCGTCRTRLLAGEADHRDLVLAAEERDDFIMICVSRALSDELVIDQ